MNYCADPNPHTVRDCRECKRIATELWRGRKQPVCRSCGMRVEVEAPDAKDYASPWRISHQLFRWIENAARTFDQESGGRRFTASDFVDWIRPDVVDSKKDKAA